MERMMERIEEKLVLIKLFDALPTSIKKYVWERNNAYIDWFINDPEFGGMLNYILSAAANAEYLSKCESPIEMLMAYEFDSVSIDVCRTLDIYFEAKSQHQIGKYRVDFLVKYTKNVLKQDSYKYLIVECDGHDFHEKTKAQAQRDKERDRFLQIEGYPILRFTGSEIFKSPASCVNQVIDFIKNHI